MTNVVLYFGKYALLLQFWLAEVAHPVFRSQKSRLLLSGEHDYRP